MTSHAVGPGHARRREAGIVRLSDCVRTQGTPAKPTRSEWTMRNDFRATIATLSLTILLLGAAIDDTTITTRVKTAMLNNPNGGGLSIDVDTFKGVVMLSGRVTSQAEHDQALAIARNMPGVTQVKDALQVIPAR